MKAPYTVHLAAVGNPDLGQPTTFTCIPARTLPAYSLGQASKMCLAFIKLHELGSGNWAGGAITKDDKPFARVSYNGKVWDLTGGELALNQ